MKARNVAMMTLGIGALGAAAYAGSKMSKNDMAQMKAKLRSAADKMMP